MIPIRLKKGVTISGLVPEMVFASQVIAGVLHKYGQEAVITSGTEGKHSKNSRHYIGGALDWRTWHLQDIGSEGDCAKEIQECLGGEFYVMLHIGSHIHVQYVGSKRS